MSPAMSAARSGSTSIRKRSVISITDSVRTLSWPRVSFHSPSSGGRPRSAICSARALTPSIVALYDSSTNGVSSYLRSSSSIVAHAALNCPLLPKSRSPSSLRVIVSTRRFRSGIGRDRVEHLCDTGVGAAVARQRPRQQVGHGRVVERRGDAADERLLLRALVGL